MLTLRPHQGQGDRPFVYVCLYSKAPYIIVIGYFQVLQKQLIKAERHRILTEYQAGKLPVDAEIPEGLYEDSSEDHDEEEKLEMSKLKKAAAAIQKAKAQRGAKLSKS